MDVNDLIAIIRLILLAATVTIILGIYQKIRFRGFFTLAVGFATSIVTVVLVETGAIKATNFIYEILTVFLAVMYFLSALSIYIAFMGYHKKHK